MIILSCNNVSKSFGVDVIIENITFSVNKGEKVGLVGVNGAGKSTLLKILTGQFTSDTGELFLSKSSLIGYLEQSGIVSDNNTLFDEGLSVFSQLIEMEERLRGLELEIASLGQDTGNTVVLEKTMEQYAKLLEEFNERNGYGFRSEIRGVFRGLGFKEEEFHQPIYQFSGGQKTRVALGKLLLKKPAILLLDEPTNHLDIEAVEWLEGFLRDYRGTLIMVSHDRYFLDQVVTRILEVENRTLHSYQGNYSQYMDKKQVLREQQLKAYIEQQKEIDRQKDIIRRLRQHGTEKLINRAKSREKQLSKLESVDLPPGTQKKAFIRFETQVKSGNDVLVVEGLGKSFADEALFQNVSFSLYRGEKIALIGPNGIGKSTLFKMLMKEVDTIEGSIRFGHQVQPAYYDQEQKSLHEDKLVIDEIWDEHISMNQTEVRTLLGAFLFFGEDVFKPIHTLSGGEKARLSLLKLILSKANLLLLDEPTNHLDIDSKEVLEEALMEYDGTVFVISHDRYFLNRVATRILELSPTGIESFLGNYSYYVEKKKEQSLLQETEESLSKTRTQIKEEKRREREEREKSKKQAKNREKIEATIMELEEKIVELEELMCQEEVYSNEEKSRQIHQETTLLKEKLENLYIEWESAIDI